MEMEGINNRRSFLDLIKIIAIVMVLFNHSNVYWWGPSIDTPVTITIVIKLMVAQILKAGAPLFFIVSGILLLGKEESFKYILRHRVSRIVIVMIILALGNIYDDISFKNFYDFFISGFNWYLYAYLLFLLMLPFMRKLVKCDDNTKIAFIFIVGIFYAVAGQAIATGINPLSGITNNAQSIFYYHGTHGGWNIVYPIAGYFLYELLNKENKMSKILFRIIIILGLCSVAMSVLVYYKDLNLTNAANYEMVRQDFIFFPTLGIEALAVRYNKKLTSLLKNRGRIIIKSLAELTFGIYLLETCTNIKSMWSDVTNSIVEFLQLSDYGTAVFKVLFTFVIYLIIVFIIRLIPFVKKIL